MKFKYRIEALTWNALMGAYNIGLQTSFLRENYMKFEWVMPDTGNNCDECKALNGVKLTAIEAQQIFPLHPHCVCFLVPSIEFEELSI